MPDLDHEFPLDPELCYLNHAAVAPWPRRAADAVQAFAEENATQGAAHYPRWMVVERRLRERLARLIGAGAAEDIALVKNTSEGLSLVAHGLDWQAGDRIVGIHADFPSNRVVWQSLAERGVEFVGVDVVDCADSEDGPEAALEAACDEHTRLMAVSSVHYATGQRLDLVRLGDFCRAHDILFCIDAIQGLGALSFKLGEVQADFVAADGHKWLLGPEGLGLFYVRPELRDSLRLYQYGWHMLEASGDYDRLDWRPSPSASRFEAGSPNLLGAHALEASLSLLEEVGMDQVEMRLLERVDYLRARIGAIDGIEVLSPGASSVPGRPERRSGILTFRHARRDAASLYRSLMAAGVVCAARGGGVRVSPHFYTPQSVLDRAIEHILKIIQ